jgi:gliding motility-associated-like protein
VFNRWGQLIFETNNPETGWDGTYKGELLNPGVYMYYMGGGVYLTDKEPYEREM